MSFHIWEGIYSDFSQCPKGQGDGWSQRWITQQTERINNLKEQINQSHESIVGYQTSLLPVISVMAGANLQKDKLKIMDFGGGLGNTYLLMSSACIKQTDFEFYVIENEEVCRKGQELFRNEGRIHFYPNLPDDVKKFDIVHCGSSMQYVEDWKGLFKTFAKYNPAFIILADLPAGKNPTYATVQNSYGAKIPYWFFNIDEVNNAMDCAGYKLIFKSKFVDKRLGIEQPLPQDNFPAEYRVGDTCNLLFSRKEI